MNNLAANLRKLRMGKKLTQEQAAARLGVSAQSVSRWETGATLPDVMLLPEIAKLYGVLVDDLFKPASKGYANNAQRLMAVYDRSHKPEDFLAAAEEFDRLFRADAATADDWRSYGIIHEYMMYHCIKKATGSYDKAMELSRGTDAEMFHRSIRQKILLRCRIGQGADCIREQEAVLLDEKFMDAMYSVAFCRGEMGQFEQAARIWDDIARKLDARGLEIEAQCPREMAEKCRAQVK